MLLYLKALFRYWWSYMSCAAFTLMGVALAFLPSEKTGFWLIRGTGALALVFCFLATYRAWQHERYKYSEEVQKNAMPSIEGEVSEFKLSGSYSSGHEHNVWYSDGIFAFDVSVCNVRPRVTTLDAIVLDGSELNPPVDFSEMVISRNPSPPLGQIMENGIRVNIKGMKTTATIRNVKEWSVERVPLGKLKAYAVDSFKNKHQLRVGEGEVLSLSMLPRE